MKKFLLLALGAGLFLGTASAQNKQSGGEKNLQVLFAPLGGSPISLNGGGISFRKFNSTGDAAFRLNVFIGLNSSKQILQSPDTTQILPGVTSPELDKKSSSFTLGIRPGYEKHFAGTDNLSPYIGAEVMFSMTTATVKTDTAMANNIVTPTAITVLTKEDKGQGASTTFGINLIAGFDYYIAKHLSLGGEFGFGWSMTSAPDLETQRFQYNATTHVPEVVSNQNRLQGSSSNLGPNVVGQLKLGWLFN